MTRSVIDPITRIEGHLRVEMEVENGVVADAWVSGGCFRGMELVVQNRTPEDAAQIVERICGVCPVSHAHASSIAGDKAYGITISNNARIVRNLLEGAQFLHSHILWLYNLAALDYVNPLNALQANVDDAYAVALENGLALHSDLNQLYEKLAAFADNGQLSIFSGNWFDADGGEAYVDNPEANLILTSHYLEALKMQARSSEMAALLGGKMPHVMTSIPGGNMWVPTESKLDDLLAMATEVRDWVNDTVLADTVMLAKLYPEVLTFGKGCGRYIAWGVFEGPDWPYGDNYTEQMLNRYLPMAVLDEQFQASDVQENLITEYMGRSWYKGSETYTSPYFVTDPDFTEYNVDDRYSWVKAPAYDGKPMEAGSMARIFAAYVRGVPFIKEQVDAVARHPRRQAGRPGRLPVHLGTHRHPPDRDHLHRQPHGGMGQRARRGHQGRRLRVLPRACPPHRRGHGLLGGPPRRALPLREGGRRQDRGLPDHHPVHVEPGSHQRRRRARPAQSRRSSAFRWPTSRSPSTPCARFTPSTPAPLAPCTSRSAVPASTSRPSPALGG